MMMIVRRNINDVFLSSLNKVFYKGDILNPRGMKSREITGFAFRITEPWKHILTCPKRFNNIAATIYETFWVLNGNVDLRYLKFFLPNCVDYSDNNGLSWRGGYGGRIKPIGRDINQIKNVIETLEKDPDSRQAIIVIGEQHDYNPQLVTKDRPCTMFVHFLIRKKQLDCYVYMRSNDILWGAFNINVFEWTTLQMIVANVLKVDMGLYQHHATSMHLYTNKDKRAENILSTTHYNIYDTFTLTQPKDNIGIDEFEHEINTFMINSYEFISEDIKEGHYPFFNKIIFDEDSILTDYFKAVYSYIEIMKILNSNLSLPTKIYIIEATFNFALTYIYRIDILTAISELLFRKLREEISVYDEIAKLHNRLIDNIMNDIRLNDDTKSFITKGEL